MAKDKKNPNAKKLRATAKEARQARKGQEQTKKLTEEVKVVKLLKWKQQPRKLL